MPLVRGGAPVPAQALQSPLRERRQNPAPKSERVDAGAAARSWRAAPNRSSHHVARLGKVWDGASKSKGVWVFHFYVV